MASRVLPQFIRTANRRALPLHEYIRTRSFVSATSPILEKKIVQVPTMGDSITEGTIVEWTVQVGQAVKDGDVVALVETDKVTVDIKADMNGVITQQFGAVDDTVEVGSNLYELDTDAEATVQASESSPTPPKAQEKEAATQAAAAAPTKPSTVATKQPNSKQAEQQRVPSIQFLGKQGWMKKLAGEPELPPLPVNYGRPAFSEEEMEALMTGGANLSPDVKGHSYGAVFGY